MSGFNGTGFLFEETVAGAAQFTGGVGAGRVSFAGTGAGSDYGTLAAEPNKVPRIRWIGYDAAGSAHEVSIRLVRVTGAVAGTARVRLGGSRIKDDGTLSLTNEASVVCKEGIPVAARDPAGGAVIYYELQVITLGKDGDGTLSVWYDIGPL